MTNILDSTYYALSLFMDMLHVTEAGTATSLNVTATGPDITVPETQDTPDKEGKFTF